LIVSLSLGTTGKENKETCALLDDGSVVLNVTEPTPSKPTRKSPRKCKEEAEYSLGTGEGMNYVTFEETAAKSKRRKVPDVGFSVLSSIGDEKVVKERQVVRVEMVKLEDGRVARNEIFEESSDGTEDDKTKRRQGPFLCEQCNLEFPFHLKLREHNWREHKKADTIFKCDQCDYQHIWRSKMRRHAECHGMGGETFCCETCGKTFHTFQGIRLHQKLHENTRYKCVPCQIHFDKPSLLRQHRLQMHPECETGIHQQIRCSVCKEVFSDRDARDDHVTLVHGLVKKYVCVCGKGFFNIQGLNVHKAGCPNGPDNQVPDQKPSSSKQRFSEYVKNKAKDICCPVQGCGRKFKFNNMLRTHFQVAHSEVRSYPCPRCGKTFKTRVNLYTHEKRHEPPTLKCTYCPKLFHTRSNWQVHVNTHLGVKPYSCHICKKLFSQIGDCKRHLSRIHGETFQKGTNLRADKYVEQEVEYDTEVPQVYEVKVQDWPISIEQKHV